MNGHITLDQYHIFYMVVKLGSMSAAARALYISQPAVSMSIAKLESAYNGKLLHRNKAGVLPTPEGNMLYENLEKAFSHIQYAENTYTRMQELNEGEIRIGASDTVSMGFLLPYLERYHAAYPGIHIGVTNRTTPETIELLEQEEVDLGFINLPYEKVKAQGDYEVFPCLTIHDCLIGGTKFLNLQRGMALTKLEQYPLLMLEKTSNTRRYLDEYASQQGISLHPNIELGSSDLLLQFVRINLGLAFVIREFYQEVIETTEEIFEIPLTPPVPPRQIGLVRKKAVPLSKAAETFIEIIKSDDVREGKE